MTDSEAGAGVSGAVSCGGNSARGGRGTLSTVCSADLQACGARSRAQGW